MTTRTRKSARRPMIKIHTTQEIVDQFAAKAKADGRSMSKQGEYLIRQHLSQATH
ncbi:MAG: hypothetical protein H8K09_13255 [Nitrospira sp.]|nr:hypothetical protein [Nitrospira sp.]